MQESLRKLKKRNGEISDSDSDDSTKKKRRVGPSYLEQELAKYSKGRGRAAAKGRRGKREEEEDLLKEMGRFSRKVADAFGERDEDEEEDEGAEPTEGGADKAGNDAQIGEDALEVDDDVGWLRHRLKFTVKDQTEQSRRAEEDYTVSSVCVMLSPS